MRETAVTSDQILRGHKIEVVFSNGIKPLIGGLLMRLIGKSHSKGLGGLSGMKQARSIRWAAMPISSDSNNGITVKASALRLIDSTSELANLIRRSSRPEPACARYRRGL